MGEKNLKSLAHLASELTRLGSRLGPARGTLLMDALRRALSGEDLTPGGLLEVFQPLDEQPLDEQPLDEDLDDGEAPSPPERARTPSREAVDHLLALVETHRALAPRILSAALKGDARLLALPPEELVGLVPLWSEAARVADSAQDLSYASLFSLLASEKALHESPHLAPTLRRIFLRGGREAAHAALAGLVTTGRIRTEDRRVLRRIDLHLALSCLPESCLAGLGLWALQEPEWQLDGAHRPTPPCRRHRLRRARLWSAAAKGAESLTPEVRGRLAQGLRHLLGDPSDRVAHLAARGLAALAPHVDLDDLWEPWLDAGDARSWPPRVAAGIGVLWARLPDRAADLLSALTSGDGAPVDELKRQAWLMGLAHALEDVAEHAPAHLEPLLEHLEEARSPQALAAAAEALAMLRIRQGSPGVEDHWIHRLDQAFGSPTGRSAQDWACALRGREALMVARGGRPPTSLRFQALLLGANALEGEPAGRVLSSLLELLDLTESRVRSLSTPPPSENPVVLGAHLHELRDLMASLVEEDLMGSLFITLSVPQLEHLNGRMEQLIRLKGTLRFALHRLAADPSTPAPWRALVLDSAADFADAVPDDPIARPSPPRAAALTQLAGLPELLRGWQEGTHPSASIALGRVLDTTLGSGSPGSGDCLVALLLATPTMEALIEISGTMAVPTARAHLEALARLGQGSAEPDAPDEARVAKLLVTSEALLGYALREGAFAAPRAKETLESVSRHLRTAASMDRPLSFMAPVRHSLEQPAEPLLVALARDLAALGRLAAEAGETARRVALQALGEDRGALAQLGAQTMSRVALEWSSWEADAVVTAEGVGDAVRRGAATVSEDHRARGEALGEAARGLERLATLTRSALPGFLGERLSSILDAWASLLDRRKNVVERDRAHPLIIDRFHIERLLGEGGMAYTYLARDPALERHVTLKVMKPDVARRPELARLFSKEGKALAALPPHPHVVQIFEHLEADTGPCLVMELVDGEPLSDGIPPKGLPLRRALDLAVSSAQGLHHVHRHHLVHLDVKAENIMVRTDGAPKIIDFGLAQRENAARETRTVLGTPVYMSPEQARGLPLAAASDVYSFGVLLYELFSGDVPFDDADPREVLKAQVLKAPPPLSSRRPDLPDGLVLLVHDMLQKDPENRPWMVEVASRLARIRSALEPGDAAPSTLERRDIAVLCASLEGLTQGARTSGASATVPPPDAVASALELFLRAADEIVSGLGGRMDATLGERVFAVFGYPRGDAQAALHGVQAATQLRRRFKRLGLPGITVFAGVATGEALVGLVRGDPTDATVLGPPLWRAARLTEEASDETPLLVDEPALLVLRGLVQAGKPRSNRLLGRYAPVTLLG